MIGVSSLFGSPSQVLLAHRVQIYLPQDEEPRFIVAGFAVSPIENRILQVRYNSNNRID